MAISKKEIYLKRKFVLDVIFFSICFVPIVFSIIMDTDGKNAWISIFGNNYEFKSICSFNYTTGYNCPVCGMTRAFVYISKFEINNATKVNFAALFLYSLCIFQIVYRGIAMIFKILYLKLIFISQMILLYLTVLTLKINFIIQFII